MSHQVKRRLAIVLAPLASIGMFFAFSAISGASADTTGTLGSSATVYTVPQCVWNLTNISDTITLTHPASGSYGDSHSKYVGLDFGLTGTSGNTVTALVGPSGASTASTSDADNCSWYGSVLHPTVTISINGTKFTATDSGDSGDHSMDFNVDGSNTLNSHTQSLFFSLATAAACYDAAVGSSSSTWSKVNTAILATGHTTTFTPLTLTQGDTTTSSTCGYTTTLSSWIPGGKTPAHPNDTYIYAGPALTTTLGAS